MTIAATRCGCAASSRTTAAFASARHILFGWRVAEPSRRFTGDFLDVRDELQIISTDERDRVTLFARAAGAANAVDVVVRSPRQIEIKDVRDVRNIEAAGCDVGCRQQHDLASAEFIQRGRARALFHVAVQCAGVETMLGQGFIQHRHVAFAVAKDNRVADVGRLDQLAQNFALGEVFAVGAKLEQLRDGLGRGRRFGDFDAKRIFQERVDQAGDLGRHRGREEQRLPARR